MIIYQNTSQIKSKNNNTQNESNYFQLTYSLMNNQSRNLNNNIEKETKNKKYSLYSTKEATPRKEYNKVIKSTTIKNSFNNQINKKNNKNYKNKKELDDDSLSQITSLLNQNKKNLNISELVGKIPGIDDEPNFLYNQLLFNKSRIKKAKLLTNKIGTLKLPLSNISFKEALNKNDIGIKCFSDRTQIKGNLNRNINNKNNKNDDVGISCCIFGKKT